jgi:hypothetical protein
MLYFSLPTALNIFQGYKIGGTVNPEHAYFLFQIALDVLKVVTVDFFMAFSSAVFLLYSTCAGIPYEYRSENLWFGSDPLNFLVWVVFVSRTGNN